MEKAWNKWGLERYNWVLLFCFVLFPSNAVAFALFFKERKGEEEEEGESTAQQQLARSHFLRKVFRTSCLFEAFSLSVCVCLCVCVLGGGGGCLCLYLEL